MLRTLDAAAEVGVGSSDWVSPKREELMDRGGRPWEAVLRRAALETERERLSGRARANPDAAMPTVLRAHNCTKPYVSERCSRGRRAVARIGRELEENRGRGRSMWREAKSYLEGRNAGEKERTYCGDMLHDG